MLTDLIKEKLKSKFGDITNFQVHYEASVVVIHIGHQRKTMSFDELNKLFNDKH